MRLPKSVSKTHRHSGLALLSHLALVVTFAFGALARTPPRQENAPLPDANQIKERVIANEKWSAKEKERYLCVVADETDELGKDGEVKHKETTESEQFYLNGQEINHTLKKNGVPLSDRDAKKERERVAKQVKKFSDPNEVKKQEDREQKQLQSFLHALLYLNGHRETRNGRSTIVYDLRGDPSFHASNLEEKFAKALVGRIWIDEQTGELLELQVHTDKDVKIAGGLVASLHKGFQMHIKQTRQTDGVWLTSLVEGTGDARAALFFHPRFRFKQVTSHCRLYSVDATSHPAN
jgi:hypothetical protein